MAPVSASTNATPARPVPPVPAERIDVPNGTELVVRLTESLSSEVNEKGDTFLASLASPIMIGDRVVIPADAGVEGKVVDVENAGRFSGRPTAGDPDDPAHLQRKYLRFAQQPIFKAGSLP